MFFVYVLKSEKDGRLYKGMTQNIENWLQEHNSGKMKSTKGYRPWALVYNKEFRTRNKAREFEKYLKSGEGRELIKDILEL